MKIYVDELPESCDFCPFYENEKCKLCKEHCALPKCEHLITLSFGMVEDDNEQFAD